MDSRDLEAHRQALQRFNGKQPPGNRLGSVGLSKIALAGLYAIGRARDKGGRVNRLKDIWENDEREALQWKDLGEYP